MTIDNATPEDASLIADAILEAVGPETVAHLAGSDHTTQEIHDLFARLAARSDTQYSYINSRIAHDSDGSPMGVCVSYDGADLRKLRRPFFAEACDTLGWEMTPEEIEAVPGETEPDEFYLDTLMTLPGYRGHGVGSALIRDAEKKARKVAKPLGLLCDKDNHNAFRLYSRLGFDAIGSRPFAGHDMLHMQLK